MIIDTHCHLDLYPNPNRIINELESKGIIAIGMTNLPSHFKQGYLHTRDFKKVRLALGMHPLMALNHRKEFPLFLKYLNLTSYIGEIGLDFSKEGLTTKDIQIESFNKVLDAVKGGNKILSIHSRGAEKEVLEYLKLHSISNAVFHWYSGGLKLIDEIVESGYYFSINTSMIKSSNGQKTINRIPIDNILIESDGPFIEYRGKSVKSSDLYIVYDYIAKVKGFSNEKIIFKIKNNFFNLIKDLSDSTK